MIDPLPLDPLYFFWILLKASLFSTGGMGNLPMIHDELITRLGIATDTQVAAALAVGQVAPGPNGLWVVSFGYLVDGMRGGLLSTLALCLPPLLVFPIEKFLRRHSELPATKGFLRGLSLGVVAALLTTLARLLLSSGLTPQTILLATAGAVLGMTPRVPVLVTLLLAAVAGILLFPR